ncbi:phosphotransferase [Affinibrenneria salicis]|uniref:Phosphotransferase n=1 Tax=Affinibrenneria salicis TaxID=2590031 RepID=A0A5J5FTY7_9GAMM|nr:phosphotransferase [Affinibrenneria salicis]KAA8996918.1 phosphotransferase [Affinibrenneria salicis]
MRQTTCAPAAPAVWDWHNNIGPLLAYYGLPADSNSTLISFSENATWLVERPDTAHKSIIRLSRPGYRSYAQIASELAWIARVRQFVQSTAAGFSTPAVIANRAGEAITRYRDEYGREQYAVMFEFIAGRQPAVTDLRDVFARLGEISALLHRYTVDDLGPAFSRPDWNIEVAIGVEGMWGCWRHNPEVNGDVWRLFARAEEKLRRELGAWGRGTNQWGLIHGDLRQANQLMTPESLYIIDFDDCGFGWYLYELACSLTLIEHQPETPYYVARWIAAYRRIRPLAATDIALIPALVIMRRLLMVGWFATHQHSFEAEIKRLRACFVDDTVELARRYLTDSYLTDLPE